MSRNQREVTVARELTRLYAIYRSANGLRRGWRNKNGGHVRLGVSLWGGRNFVRASG